MNSWLCCLTLLLPLPKPQRKLVNHHKKSNMKNPTNGLGEKLSDPPAWPASPFGKTWCPSGASCSPSQLGGRSASPLRCSRGGPESHPKTIEQALCIEIKNGYMIFHIYFVHTRLYSPVWNGVPSTFSWLNIDHSCGLVPTENIKYGIYYIALLSVQCCRSWGPSMFVFKSFLYYYFDLMGDDDCQAKRS